MKIIVDKIASVTKNIRLKKELNIRKKIISKGFRKMIVDDFPIRGRKGELVFMRRTWEVVGANKILRREINVCVPGTKLEKEFADFLKEFDRE